MTAIESFDGKAVLITGAADGIGLALAGAFKQAGARVFLSDVAEEKLAERASALGAPSRPCDVTDTEQVEALVEAAWQELGGIDVLCANAGVFVPGSALDASEEDIAYQFDVNVWGMLRCARPFVRRLRAAGRGGHILFTGSENSLATPSYLKKLPGHVYNMTKHAVLSLADGLRHQLEDEAIGVSVLCPGPVASGLVENSTEFRPGRYGAAGELDFDVGAVLDEDAIQKLAGLYMTADEAAAIALEGLRRGCFVIPTHRHELDDATERFRDIERGFTLL